MGKKRRRGISREQARRSNRATIYVASGLFSLTCIRIDRNRDRAIFCTLGLALPSWRVISPLSLIVGAQISKQKRAGQRQGYGIAVRLFQGKPIRFACRSRTVATATMQALQQQLHVETRSSSPAKLYSDSENTAQPRHCSSQATA
jgi:hypothetical protein